MVLLPKLKIDLSKIYHNTRTLVERLALQGISVTGVTKATLGSSAIATTILRAGVHSLGDSRIENIERIRLAKVPAVTIMIRTPMLSRARRIVINTDISCNTELKIVQKLSSEAKKLQIVHGVILMVELGDLREGLMPEDVLETVREILKLPNIILKGIGTNLACRSGVSPDNKNMAVLSELTESIESTFGINLEIISGGNSANLNWALSGADVGRVNNLRLGEAILLGCETLHRKPIEGLYTDAITLSAEVIEVKLKPTKPLGVISQNAFGEVLNVEDRGSVTQAILAIGQQDVDPLGLKPLNGVKVMSASSDHLIIESSNNTLTIGSNHDFKLNYNALLRAMTSPFVKKVIITHT